MINIGVYSRDYVEIETESYLLDSRENLINFIESLIDKVKYGGEAICLEIVEENEEEKNVYTTVKRW